MLQQAVGQHQEAPAVGQVIPQISSIGQVIHSRGEHEAATLADGAFEQCGAISGASELHECAGSRVGFDSPAAVEGDGSQFGADAFILQERASYSIFIIQVEVSGGIEEFDDGERSGGQQAAGGGGGGGT